MALTTSPISRTLVLVTTTIIRSAEGTPPKLMATPLTPLTTPDQVDLANPSDHSHNDPLPRNIPRDSYHNNLPRNPPRLPYYNEPPRHHPRDYVDLQHHDQVGSRWICLSSGATTSTQQSGSQIGRVPKSGKAPNTVLTHLKFKGKCRQCSSSPIRRSSTSTPSGSGSQGPSTVAPPAYDKLEQESTEEPTNESERMETSNQPPWVSPPPRK